MRGVDMDEDPLVELFLAAKIVVKQGLVDARMVGDLLHARPRESLVGKDFQGGVKDLVFGVGGDFTRHCINWFN